MVVVKSRARKVIQGRVLGVWVGVLRRGDGSFLWENSCRQTKPLWKRAIAVKCTTGLSAHQFAELTQWISQSKPLHTIPAILGVAGSLVAAGDTDLPSP